MQLQSIVDKNYHGANMSAAAMWTNLQSALKLTAMIERYGLARFDWNPRSPWL